MNGPNRTTTLWVIATFTLAMLPQLLRMPPAVAAMALFPLAWRVGSELRDWKPLPAVVRHTLTALALLALFFSYGDMSGRRAAVSLLAVMLSLKLIECYRIRDARLVVSFSLFLCATQFLFGQKILMPVYATAVTILALVTLTRLQRLEAWQHEGQPPTVRASLFSELGFGLRLLALAIPIGFAFFMLFPRLHSPLWGIPETTLDSKSGLSNSMSPGSIQQMYMDDSPAFRVKFDGPVPEFQDRYWRGPVFWRFDGRTWRDSFYSRNLLAENLPSEDAEGGFRYTVQMEPNERKWLLALDYPAFPPPNSKVTVDYQVIRRGIRDFADHLPRELQLHATELPEDANPRTQTLMEQWRLETPDDLALVARVYEYFSRDPFRYTLEAPLLGVHSIDEFLFETRAGFCEHYASATAVMLRMAGIPARIVTGYLGGYYNAMGEYMLVRQSDAHAWVEYWIHGQGWMRIDPTAAISPARIERGSFGAVEGPRYMLDFPWLRQVKNSVDIVQQRWNDWVIEYGATQQANLLAPLGLGAMTPGTLVLALAVVIGLFSLAVIPVVLRIRGPAEKDPARKAWLKFLKSLEETGFSASLSDGPLELAAAASANLPRHRAVIGRIADLYARCRYSPDPPPVDELKRAVKDFRPKKTTG
jgi:transglutaminase-like putative cysteine protease